MLKVGLTGGIGSGKTTVARIFHSIGIPVYDADSAAKRIMNDNPQVIKSIISLFGQGSYREGKLDRSFISDEIRKDSDKLQQLNSIVHPATIEDARVWMSEQDAPYSIKEAAILFEAGTDKYVDFVIGVTAPKETRIKRVMDRDGKTRDEILNWMANQMDEEEKMTKCDFVIINDERQHLIPRVLKIHNKLLGLSKN